MMEKFKNIIYHLLTSSVAIGCYACYMFLYAQDTTAGYTQPSLVKTLRMELPARFVSYPFWVDQTTSIFLTVSSLTKNLSVKLIDPQGSIFTHGQPSDDRFQSILYPDPQAVPDAPGVHYYLNLENPIPGHWTLQIDSAGDLSSPLTLPLSIVFNNRVGPVLLGGGNGPVGKPVSFSLAVMDGATKVSNLQINTTLYRLDDTNVASAAIAFADDGQGADYAAGDAIYSALITPTQPGSYMLQVEVSGDASTGHFQRSTASGFKVVPKTATFTGAFQERAIIGEPK